jgi:hypothetical protein
VWGGGVGSGGGNVYFIHSFNVLNTWLYMPVST